MRLAARTRSRRRCTRRLLRPLTAIDGLVDLLRTRLERSSVTHRFASRAHAHPAHAASAQAYGTRELPSSSSDANLRSDQTAAPRPGAMAPSHGRPLRPSRARAGLLGKVAAASEAAAAPKPPAQRRSGRLVLLVVLALALAALLAGLVGGGASSGLRVEAPAVASAAAQTPRRVGGADSAPAPAPAEAPRPQRDAGGAARDEAWVAEARAKAAAALAKASAAAAEAAARHAAAPSLPPPPQPPPLQARRTQRLTRAAEGSRVFSQLAQAKAPPLSSAPGLLPLPPFSPELLQQHSNEIPGQVRIARFAVQRWCSRCAVCSRLCSRGALWFPSTPTSHPGLTKLLCCCTGCVASASGLRRRRSDLLTLRSGSLHEGAAPALHRRRVPARPAARGAARRCAAMPRALAKLT